MLLGIHPLILLVLAQALVIIVVWIVVAVDARAEHDRRLRRTIEILEEDRRRSWATLRHDALDDRRIDRHVA